MTYNIVRYYENGNPKRVIQYGVNLEEAQTHCSRDDTRKAQVTRYHDRGTVTEVEHVIWFDGFERQA